VRSDTLYQAAIAAGDGAAAAKSAHRYLTDGTWRNGAS
jgi:thioredoxin reductase